MKRLMALVGAVLIVLILAGVSMARDTYVVSSIFGEHQHGPISVTNPSDWKEAPDNPKVVYIAVWTPNPYRKPIIEALVRAVTSSHLKPVVVDNVSAYDLKGRVVIFYAPIIGRSDGLLSSKRSLSGILYYSYAGDAKSIVRAINKGIVFSEDKLDDSAADLCGMSIERLTSLRIVNQTCTVAYWWNLRARVGTLDDENPYALLASKIGKEMIEIIRGS